MRSTFRWLCVATYASQSPLVKVGWQGLIPLGSLRVHPALADLPCAAGRVEEKGLTCFRSPAAIRAWGSLERFARHSL
eukprot:6645528-Prorocentrum_lima.AAC.1